MTEKVSYYCLKIFYRTLTLDEASERLSVEIGLPASKTRSVSVKRRLYDITNVMLVLGLVEKVKYTRDYKKCL